jgi:hypothetical protein
MPEKMNLWTAVDEDLVVRLKNMVVEALGAAWSLEMALGVTRQSLQWAGRLIEGFESVNPLPKPIACQLGCTFCCHNEVEVTPPEAFLIAQVIRYHSLSLKIAKYPAPPDNRVESRVDASMRRN